LTNIFVLCSGQEDNIGDVVLRRIMLAELRMLGRLHVVLGDASPPFIEGLELGPDDRVYAEKKAWRRDLWKSIRSCHTWLVDKPGELLLDRRHLAAQTRLAVAALAVRFRGGTVLRLGLGQRSPNTTMTRLFRPVLATANIIAWRDPQSRSSFGIGEVMPDWGFGEAAMSSSAPRRRLALSYRSDRPELSDRALAGILSAARHLDLEPVVVTQVGRDDERSRALASRLGCELIDWPDGRTHKEQEHILRQIYAQCALVLSDRLHVLIVAMTEGAIPLGLTGHAESKIGRHFDAIGLDAVSVRIASDDQDDFERIILAGAARANEVADALAGAHRDISKVVARVRARSHAVSSSSRHG
jgi:hypothetical protein